VLAGVNTIYAAMILPESLPVALRRPVRWQNANPIGSMRVLFVDNEFRRLALAWCCTWFALGTLQSSFVLANQVRLGWGEQQNGLTLAAVGIGSALVQGFLVRRLVPGLGERRAALIGYSLSGVAYVMFAFAWNPALLFFGVALQALGAISGPAVQALLSGRAGADQQGGIQGALASVQGLTAIVAPLLAGWVFSVFANPTGPAYFPGAPFLMAAAAYLCAVVAIWTVRDPARS
jgi:DHA1 family tetracycline resistance protein-like MFS transporter